MFCCHKTCETQMGLVCPSGTHINKHAVRNQSQDQHTQGQVFQSSASNAKTTKLKRAVIAASPAFWLLKPQKFISQSVSNISDDYVVSKRGRQHVEAFSFLSQSWQMGRGLEQLFNLKASDLTLSLFTFLSSQSYPPKYFFPNFTVSYCLFTVFCPKLSVASTQQSVNKIHNCLH